MKLPEPFIRLSDMPKPKPVIYEGKHKKYNRPLGTADAIRQDNRLINHYKFDRPVRREM